MKKIIIISTAIILFLLPVLFLFYLNNGNTNQNIVEYFHRIKTISPFLGVIVFCILQILIAVCGVLPASVGAVTSGMIFGLQNGFLIASTTTLVGALIAFWLSRSIFRSPIQSFLNRHKFFLMLERMTEKQGWKMVCLLRISPILPFAVTSYVLGFTELSTADYILGTLASLPALLGYVFIGTLTQNGFSQTDTGSIFYIKIAISLVAIVGTLFLIRNISQLFKKYIESI
ncbi:TVP38/TMEM64 family protein [Acetobacter orientalis]|nr:VTT domain-containing protein [Acetobacter orientalis]GBR16084.1 hypothetical protein AA0481_1020 [Acetobacter orientalis NRIC 0481]